MTELLTSAQMRAIEQAAMASGAVTGLELMERAGRSVVEAIFEEWPELGATSHRAVVLCGPGNNGGDGFVVARLLKEWGWKVHVYLYGNPENLPSDARVNHERWLALGEVVALSDDLDFVLCDELTRLVRQEKTAPVLVIDALFGIGLSRAVKQTHHNDFVMLCVDLDDVWMDGGPEVRFVAIDVPSGLCADSGRILSPELDEPDAPSEIDADPRFFALNANLTVTFHRPKLGHVIGRGPQICGVLRIADIGLEPKRGVSSAKTVELVSPPFRCVGKQRANHKYTHGHALVLSGPSGHGGAARLAARGALRIGAGLVTLGCQPDAMPENAARLDAVMLRPVADDGALADVLRDKRITALCIGPALGVGDREAGLVRAALAKGKGDDKARALVLDADALTILARNPDLFASLHDRCVLTPHAGEFARLFPDIAEKLAAPATKGPAYSKVDAAREAAARAGCVILFKGPDTVIATPDGRCAINSAHYDRAAPWLATAGSGDVLAGFITGLLARGFAPFDAACTAAWLHVECARSFGPGLIAEDLPDELPKVFRQLNL